MKDSYDRDDPLSVAGRISAARRWGNADALAEALRDRDRIKAARRLRKAEQLRVEAETLLATANEMPS